MPGPRSGRRAVRSGPLGDQAGVAGGAGLGADGVEIAAEIVLGWNLKAAVLHGLAKRGGDIEAAGAGHQHALDPDAVVIVLELLDHRLAHAGLIDGDAHWAVALGELAHDLALFGEADVLADGDLARP